jgi:hypothetical protein
MCLNRAAKLYECGWTPRVTRCDYAGIGYVLVSVVAVVAAAAVNVSVVWNSCPCDRRGQVSETTLVTTVTIVAVGIVESV